MNRRRVAERVTGLAGGAYVGALLVACVVGDSFMELAAVACIGAVILAAVCAAANGR